MLAKNARNRRDPCETRICPCAPRAYPRKASVFRRLCHCPLDAADAPNAVTLTPKPGETIRRLPGYDSTPFITPRRKGAISRSSSTAPLRAKTDRDQRITGEVKPTRHVWLVRGDSSPPSLWSTSWPGACRWLHKTARVGICQTRVAVGAPQRPASLIISYLLLACNKEQARPLSTKGAGAQPLVLL